MRLPFLLAILLQAALFASASPYDEGEARAWCDTNVLCDVEGIWEYPEDGARVLIKADATQPGSYTLSIVSTADCRLEPGDVIGRLHSSADARQFRLNQSTKKDKNVMSRFFDCVAVLSADGETLRVKSPRLKLKITPYTILPRFWRAVRIGVENPTDDLPRGLVKVYPGYDHNGSMRRTPRIL